MKEIYPPDHCTLKITICIERNNTHTGRHIIIPHRPATDYYNLTLRELILISRGTTYRLVRFSFTVAYKNQTPAQITFESYISICRRWTAVFLHESPRADMKPTFIARFRAGNHAIDILQLSGPDVYPRGGGGD